MKHYLYKLDELCFETASKEFRLIDDDGMNVIVNWENSMGLVENLKKVGLYIFINETTGQVYCRCSSLEFQSID